MKTTTNHRLTSELIVTGTQAWLSTDSSWQATLLKERKRRDSDAHLTLCVSQKASKCR